MNNKTAEILGGNMKRAIIDIGTNSVRLLEAEKNDSGDWSVKRKEVKTTRLGEGMTDQAMISSSSK